MEILQILVPLLVIALFIYRQTKTYRTDRPSALYVAGAMIVLSFVAGGLVDPAHLALSLALLVAEVVSALGLAAWRAATVRVWLDGEGTAWTKATGWTLLAWLVSIAVRAGLYFAGDSLGVTVSTGGLLLFVGLTLGAQAYLIIRRGRLLTGATARPGTVVR
ncbi:hypothetical protein MF672_039800 [Actinomadura sp. ATCC 31491]|uniref:DUF1453 domain-containing protein n=1 Tax=Actinomadura luzonensis TaxID=2805427 RepID=A0ABT0G720_9ACTN|nr:hypothetical protein [Actinomadura luzonensis]MCK2219898.1 hypothetical protein [Actinomadura luzonensis]